ncbi:MAG TPA: hypothetical protein VK524_09945, partial [Polyangiaceae bacterium]|nr:hypothetical protein [Polyangiaceae bacterium]
MACDAAFLFESPADAPPDYCVPPCLWNAFRACADPEVESCVEQANEIVPEFPSVCDPEAGWMHVNGYRGGGYGQAQLRTHGNVCLWQTY